ncbi:hypothetical protein B0T16DRAFT_313441, partial [Cercophora newfieldiana]
KLRNNLLPAIGFIELANAGDFPANLWNQSPLPRYAVILMAFGGTLALSMLPFVVMDAVLSWRNVLCLHDERICLRQRRREVEETKDDNLAVAVDCLLGVNFREQGTEWVDRFGMDTIMGLGAFVVGVGTYMAIGGADPRVHLASDLLTGYIGNSPCALYGLMNLAWSIFVWLRASKHTRAPQLIPSTDVKKLLENRATEFKMHSLMSGMTGMVAGCASLLTYTYWQAYVVLAACLVFSVILNFFWRHRLGYHRPIFQEGHVMVFYGDDIINALQYTIYWEKQLAAGNTEGTHADPLSVLRPMLASLPDVTTFLRRQNLFDEFCLELCSKYSHDTRLFPDASTVPLTINEIKLLHLAAESSDVDAIIRDVAKEVIKKAVPTCFKYQQRWLLEVLGCYRAILE